MLADVPLTENISHEYMSVNGTTHDANSPASKIVKPLIPPDAEERMSGVKKAKRNNLTLCPRQGPVPPFCPESAENCHGRDSLDSPGSGNFPQSPAKLCSPSVRLKVGVRSRNGASFNFRSGAIRGDFQPV